MAKFNELLNLESEGDGPSSIKAQVLESMSFDAENPEDVTQFDILCHWMTFNWKTLFAILPLKSSRGGQPLFVASLMMIGILTMFVGDVAKIMGCTLGVSDLLTAITFVALGTSLPDTFASMTAADQDENADAAIGNVTGSNSVNVFLGLGLPWVCGVFYHEIHDTNPRDIKDKWCEDKYGYTVNNPNGIPLTGQNSRGIQFYPSDGLNFSTLIQVILAFTAIGIMTIRRKQVGGELGGTLMARRILASIFLFMWII